MSELIAKSEILKNIRKGFLWTGVTILIGELVFGAILIMMGGWTFEIGKIQFTFLLLGVYLFVGVNNFVRIEKGNSVTQGLAWMSLGFNLVALVFGVLLLWEIIPVVEYVDKTVTEYLDETYTFRTTISSIYSKIALIVLSLGMAGFWISNVLSIRETVKPVKPLKITAMICEIYCVGFAIVATIIGLENITSDENLLKWEQLCRLCGLAFVITALAALIISVTNRAKVDSNDVSMQKDKGMQTAIQEMVEKEVQKRLRTELGKTNNETASPAQLDDASLMIEREEKSVVAQTDPVAMGLGASDSATSNNQVPTQISNTSVHVNESPAQATAPSVRSDGGSVQVDGSGNPVQK